MPANTWTLTALASEARPWDGRGWRAVEAQHRIATMTLVGGRIAEQAVLESILEEAKPALPAATGTLHWLLATPFRYRPLFGGSRFRRRGDPGVFYGAENRATACAESGYWRLRFWQDSAGLSGQSTTVELSLFEFHASTALSVDLTRPPLDVDRPSWIDPIDYGATQTLAETARAAGIEAIRYESARLANGVCLALLAPQVFARVRRPYRDVQQTWSFTLLPPDRVVCQRHLGTESYAFSFPQPL